MCLPRLCGPSDTLEIMKGKRSNTLCSAWKIDFVMVVARLRLLCIHTLHFVVVCRRIVVGTPQTAANVEKDLCAKLFLMNRCTDESVGNGWGCVGAWACKCTHLFVTENPLRV